MVKKSKKFCGRHISIGPSDSPPSFSSSLLPPFSSDSPPPTHTNHCRHLVILRPFVPLSFLNETERDEIGIKGRSFDQSIRCVPVRRSPHFSLLTGKQTYLHISPDKELKNCTIIKTSSLRVYCKVMKVLNILTLFSSFSGACADMSACQSVGRRLF